MQGGDTVLVSKYVPTCLRRHDALNPDSRAFVARSTTSGSARASNTRDGALSIPGACKIKKKIISDMQNSLDRRSNLPKSGTSDGDTPMMKDTSTPSGPQTTSASHPSAIGDVGSSTARPEGISKSTSPISGGASPAQEVPSTGKGSTPASKAGKQTNVSHPPHQAAVRGVGTSFKQKLHARQAGAKFRAAYNRAGPAFVNIVENAAAYFEGKVTPEVAKNQTQSFERYQFNVEMLNEIFDGPQYDGDDGEETMVEGGEMQTNGTPIGANTNTPMIMRDMARKVIRADAKKQSEQMTLLEDQFRNLEEEMKQTERVNMRLYQRVERAESVEQIEELKRDLQQEYGIHLTIEPPPIQRRKVDKSLPKFSFDNARIIHFKAM